MVLVKEKEQRGQSMVLERENERTFTKLSIEANLQRWRNWGRDEKEGIWNSKRRKEVKLPWMHCQEGERIQSITCKAREDNRIKR